MSAGKYDPFALERPVLRLGEHGSWTLGDITESRGDKLNAMIGKFGEMGEDAKLSDLAPLVGELCETACINGEGLKNLIVELCDESKHGEDALGIKALTGVVMFVTDWFGEEATAGEG